MTTLVFSIHSRYVEPMCSGDGDQPGDKRWEFRRVRPRLRPGDRALVYETARAGRGMIVAEFVAGRVLELCPCALWRATREHAGVTRDEFFAYFEDREVAYAVELLAVRAIEPVPLGKRGPQSWGKLGRTWEWGLSDPRRRPEVGDRVRVIVEPGAQLSHSWPLGQVRDPLPYGTEGVVRSVGARGVSVVLDEADDAQLVGLDFDEIIIAPAHAP